MSRRSTASLAVAAAAFAVCASATAATDAPRIVHEALSCVPGDGNARVTAVVTSGAPITSVRVYFRAVEKSQDYFLEMRRAENGSYWAVLPVPESGTKAVQYKLFVRDGDGLDASTEPFVARTGSNCPVTLSDEEKRYAANLVIGLTSDAQNAIPDGFRCVGLVSKITVNGELKPNDECKKVPAALWVAGGAAALLGGGAIIIGTTGGDETPASTARPVPRHPRLASSFAVSCSPGHTLSGGMPGRWRTG
jgi:hypothetical protein